LTAGFVKKPRQHYGVVYVFCLTSSQNSPDQETRFIYFTSLSRSLLTPGPTNRQYSINTKQ
jgi:hypothetical protein